MMIALLCVVMSMLCVFFIGFDLYVGDYFNAIVMVILLVTFVINGINDYKRRKGYGRWK